jgi:hypothetical protein
MRQWKMLASALLVLTIASVPNTEATAQFGPLLGSSDGSTCVFRSRNRIRVLSSLPRYSDTSYLQRMTLRRLAEMTRSRGYDSFVMQQEQCVMSLQFGSEIGRSCDYKATMTNEADTPIELADDGNAYTVAAIFAQTDGEASSYPRRTGIFERGNDCVVD